MKVMITGADRTTWWNLCHQMVGESIEPIEEYVTLDDNNSEYQAVLVFDIDDQHPLATWVQLQHPGWLEHNFQDHLMLEQPDHPFLEIIEDEDC